MTAPKYLVPDYEGAKQYVLGRLASELSPDLLYHGLRHTRDDVLPAAIRLGRAEGVKEQDLMLLQTAALYHDAGFLVARQDHERHSMDLARAALPRFGYSAGQIETVCGIIAATRLPQRPENLLQELMCDADLDLLGRDDFMKLNYELLMEVRRVTGRLISDADWLRAQVQFLCNHRYFTAAARASRAEGEKRNIALLDAALALH